ncbi:RDD family protein [Thiomicrorhabdus sp. Kp2]|uniref:RDD family protein n=1 Tax=Thiomicrorhabdus sp. Kp2 TaxID=1123518 RepID=UPI0003F7614D|nr:RDD family protein [Thiomicrorhabdus sp. Kp2]
MSENLTTENTVQYAGFWRRFLAYIVDWAVLTVLGIFLVIGYSMFLAFMGNDLGDEASVLMFQAQAKLLTFLMAWLYYAVMESSAKQATLGKLALGIKVTSLQGESISFLRASVRFFSKILSALLFFIGFIMIAFTEKKQGLHDMIAGAIVIKRESSKA